MYMRNIRIMAQKQGFLILEDFITNGLYQKQKICLSGFLSNAELDSSLRVYFIYPNST